ncbi:MAG TPA: ATP-binding protein [Ruminococcaceae bacterium]|nr:ATP-binding protein [Oscillospiraceae bacterium]
MSATVFLICGNTAAGKSTYSAKLAEETGGIRFSVDPWMQTLYGEDYDPKKNDFVWLIERTERCKTQMRQIAEQLISRGVDIVLDFGFGDRESRVYYREWAASHGARAVIHFLDVPAGERRKRVHRRNAEKGGTFAFTVTDEMFDYVEAMFNPPSEEELAGGTRVLF